MRLSSIQFEKFQSNLVELRYISSRSVPVEVLHYNSFNENFFVIDSFFYSN